MDADSRDNIRLTAPERKRQPSLPSSEPPGPTEAATFAASENAKVRNAASLDRCFRHGTHLPTREKNATQACGMEPTSKLPFLSKPRPPSCS